MKEPDYRGIAALVIAVCGAIGIFIVPSIGLLFGVKYGDGGVLLAIGGALAGALAVYMGMKMKNGDRDGDQ